jgi:hypothetical protein
VTHRSELFGTDINGKKKREKSKYCLTALDEEAKGPQDAWSLEGLFITSPV